MSERESPMNEGSQVQFDEFEEEQGSSGTLSPPNIQPQVMEGLEDESAKDRPEAVGTRFRDIDPEDLPAVWDDLRQWVDWAIAEYGISRQSIPPCWYRHRYTVTELYAMRCAEEQVWDNDGLSSQPAFQLQPQMQAMIQRLSNQAGKCLSERKHVEEESYGGLAAESLVYDEQDWAQFLTAQTDVQTLAKAEGKSLWWRRRVELVDKDGQIETVLSDPILIGAKDTIPGIKIKPTQILSAGVDSVQVSSIVQGGLVEESFWESAETKDAPAEQWTRLDVSHERPRTGVDSFDLEPED